VEDRCLVETRARSNLFDLRGTTALVTGGNSGLGLAYARGLARHGANVVIWGRDEAKSERAAETLRALGATVARQKVDVTDEHQVVRGFASAVEMMGRINCVIQNAGFSNPASSFLNMTSAQWSAQIEVALTGGFYTLREAARHMVKSAADGFRNNSIILCGSGLISAGMKGLEHYAAAKAGLAAMMRCMVAELSEHGIRINMISPGYTRTEIAVSQELVDFIAKRTPLKRVAETEDLEAAAVYLASPGARHHTGDVLTIDGGWLASYL
jgi:NAD(P)-dependent dehydrogenase (short-subunit alcohol dehydrogenase family)